MQNHSEIAEFLWKIADLIKDDYDAKDYEDVILPFTLLRRLDCVLQPTRQAVRDAALKYKTTPEQTRDAQAEKQGRPVNVIRYILDLASIYGEDYPSETFRVLKSNEMRQLGEYRTQRLVLEAWDRLA